MEIVSTFCNQSYAKSSRQTIEDTTKIKVVTENVDIIYAVSCIIQFSDATVSINNYANVCIKNWDYPGETTSTVYTKFGKYHIAVHWCIPSLACCNDFC